jgi:hypothetical protein
MSSAAPRAKAIDTRLAERRETVASRVGWSRDQSSAEEAMMLGRSGA